MASWPPRAPVVGAGGAAGGGGGGGAGFVRQSLHFMWLQQTGQLSGVLASMFSALQLQHSHPPGGAGCDIGSPLADASARGEASAGVAIVGRGLVRLIPRRSRSSGLRSTSGLEAGEAREERRRGLSVRAKSRTKLPARLRRFGIGLVLRV